MQLPERTGLTIMYVELVTVYFYFALRETKTLPTSQLCLSPRAAGGGRGAGFGATA